MKIVDFKGYKKTEYCTYYFRIRLFNLVIQYFNDCGCFCLQFVTPKHQIEFGTAGFLHFDLDEYFTKRWMETL
jgi:hypothetical protein